jgi:CheY-like chemotaxis protein
MAQRVFVNVVGFTDVERHALNSVFRLSEDHEIIYSLWEPQAPVAAQLALIDGQSYEGRVHAESPSTYGLPFLWIGSPAPAAAIRSFQRPIPWTEVVHVMDGLFAPASEPVDVEVDIDFNVDTLPPDTQPPDMPPARRALIVNADRDQRLYLRAKLALAQLCEADEAESAAQALELARDNDYVLAVIDFDLPGSGWQLLKDLDEGGRRIGKVIATKQRPSVPERIHARFAGLAGFFEKPPHPGKLHAALLKV